MTDDQYPAPGHLPDDVANVWREVVAAHVDAGDESIGRKLRRLEAYCSLVAIQRGASARVSEHGDTVLDQRSAPVRNPAVDIVSDMNRELARWGDLFEPKQPRAARGRR